MTDLPLTQFFIALLSMTPSQVRKASAKRAADKYGIRLEHAEGYIRQQRELRGVA